MAVQRKFNSVYLIMDDLDQIVQVRVNKSVEVENPDRPGEFIVESRNTIYVRDVFQPAELTHLDDVLPIAIVPMLNRESPVS